MAQSAPTMQKTIEREATDEEIRQRAYEIYFARGAAPGFEVDDWLQAERELRKRVIQEN